MKTLIGYILACGVMAAQIQQPPGNGGGAVTAAGLPNAGVHTGDVSGTFPATLVNQIHETRTSINFAASPYAVLAADTYLSCDASGGAVVINLPATSGSGRDITIKKTDSSVNACTFTRAGSDVIDGATTVALTSQYAAAKVKDRVTGTWDRTHINQLGGDVTGVSSGNVVGSIGGKAVSLSGNFTTTGAFNPTFAIPSSSTWTFPAAGTLIGSADSGTVTNAMLAGSIAPSKITGTAAILGANTFTATQSMLGWTCYDPTVTTGVTSCVIREGAGQGTTSPFTMFGSDGITEKTYMGADGAVYVGGRTTNTASGIQAVSGFALGVSVGIGWTAGNPTQAKDTSLWRGAAGEVWAGLGTASGSAGTFRGLYKSSDGSAGVTGSTCTAWKNGLCTTP